MRVALTRKISPEMARCELTHLPRTQIDISLAEAQHAGYEHGLASLGCRVESLPAEPDFPDSVFVEDVAVVLKEVAVITRPGAESRRGETMSVAEALARYRPLVHLQPPAVLDGGDVLRVGQRLWVGLSGRTNAAGVQQLKDAAAPYGYSVEGVSVRGCLHLKSAVTQVALDLLLINPEWVDADRFAGIRILPVAASEAWAANALLVGETVIFPAAFPETRRLLGAQGIRVLALDVSELAKAEGGVTCCSLIFDV